MPISLANQKGLHISFVVLAGLANGFTLKLIIFVVHSTNDLPYVNKTSGRK